MNAIEFVKKFGFGEARSVLLKSKYHHEVDVYLVDTKEFTYIAIQPSENDPFVSLTDLKQIVNAFELVKIRLPELKKSMFSNSKDLDYIKNWFLAVSEKLLTEKGIKLKQAIELVEKCK